MSAPAHTAPVAGAGAVALRCGGVLVVLLRCQAALCDEFGAA